MDVLEELCIKKCSPEHTLIQEQITGEKFLTHSYVMPLLELVLASALMFQSCACRVTHYTLLNKLVCIKNFGLPSIFYKYSIILCFFLHSNNYHDVLTCKYVLFEFRNLHLVTHFVELPY